MTKIQFAAAVAEKAGLTNRQAEKAVNSVMDVVMEALAKGEKVQLTGFGTFEVRERAARTGLNPLTKKTIKIPASKTPAFKAGSKLKDAVK
jgi:DNA-binding protein HU-beta